MCGEIVTARPEAYEQLLEELDELEEYVPGDARSLYERVARDAVRADGVTVVRAWVYVAAPAVAARLRSGGKLIEDGDCARGQGQGRAWGWGRGRRSGGRGRAEARPCGGGAGGTCRPCPGARGRGERPWACRRA